MELELTEELGDYQRRARAFIASHAPSIPKRPGTRSPDPADLHALRTWWASLFSEGFLGRDWPVDANMVGWDALLAHDLKTFFTVIDKDDKDPVDVVPADVFAFIADQRGDRSVVRISDGESGLSARTIARRLSSISGLYAYLVAHGDTAVSANPVPRGLSTRRRGGRRERVALVRVPRTLPKVLSQLR